MLANRTKASELCTLWVQSLKYVEQMCENKYVEQICEKIKQSKKTFDGLIF